MTDIVDVVTRSRMMRGIRGKDTKPEILVRKGLFALGFRYRLHDRKLAGKPDLVLPRYRAAVFVQGCFWHGHECHLFKWPKTREDFWKEKIDGNRQRDLVQREKLLDQGWRVATVWECSLRGAGGDTMTVCNQIAAWVAGNSPELEISA
jgi:DNA mismatch endonuclease, patch repair protein